VQSRGRQLSCWRYTLGAALIAHHYWTMTGAAQLDNMIHFYKNISIMGGFLLLYVTGPGKYSVDAKFGMPEAKKNW
jgi:putative oxidoreductase